MKNLSGKFTPIMMFDVYQLFELLFDGVEKAREYIEESEKELKKIADHKWGNSNCYLKFNGEFFQFLISKEYDGEIRLHVWSKHEEVLETSFPLKDNKKYLENLQHHVHYIMSRYTQGYIICSDCGEEHKRDEIQNNRYFAGIYCEKCWNKTWKAIEAKETYN